MTNNIYYDPEKFGLTVVTSCDDAGSWEFNTTVMFKDAAGKLYLAYDSGCSCPTPFGGMGLNDLTPVTDEDQVRSWLASRHGHLSPGDVLDFVRAVRDGLKAPV